MKNTDHLTLGSLFDGSGGFPLGGLLNGIVPVWASEIEPFPIRVTTKRLPFMKHLGDISQIKGSEIEPVDIITFGSPCTDMSLAGKRAGLEGKQSSLFHQAIRIVREMREKTNGAYPRYIVWENVPGAFSSNGGADFKSVIEEVIGIRYQNMPVPQPSKWTGAGLVVEDDFSLAWRVLDAQYWGVPQRRKRIYLVADLAGGSAGKVLFEPEGMPWHTPACFRTRQDAPGCAPNGIGDSGEICLNDQGGQRMDITDGLTSTLRAQANYPPIVLENHPTDGRIKIEDSSVCQTLTSRMGTGGNNVPLLLDTPKTLKIRCGKEGGGKGALIQDDISATLSCNNDQTLFAPAVFGICSKASHAMQSDNPKSGFYEAETTRTLDANGGDPSCNQGGMAVVYCTSKNSFHTKAEKELSPTLVASEYKDPPVINAVEPPFRYIVRRLTPTECARLQGFPDWWCDGLGNENPSDEEIAFWRDVFLTHGRIAGKAAKAKSDSAIRKWLGSPHSDAAEYKMWGNGVALPNVAFVLAGIARCSSEGESNV